MHINVVLQRLIHEKSFTISRFARELGVQRDYVYKILRGEHIPSLIRLEEIALLLHMKLSEFILLCEACEEK